MAIAFDAASTSSGDTSSSSFSWSHTTSGSDRCLVVIVAISSTAGDPSATYNGVSMTRQFKISNGTQFCLFYLANPASGTNTVAVNMGFSSGSHSRAAVAMSYTGVHQSSTIDGSNTANDASGSGVSITTSFANTMIVGGYAVLGTAGFYEYYDLTERGSAQGTSVNNVFNSSGDRAVTTAGSYSMTWYDEFGGSSVTGAIGLREAVSAVNSGFLGFM